MREETALIQKLMSADEVYIYKIPPMKDSGGHRAEDWDLAKPLQTCSLLVERRGDALFLDFNHQEKLFAQSKMDLREGFDLNHWLEQAVDSSRYFALKIQGAGGREATIGFGFRDRDQATDLRESLQHYKKSMGREKEAESLSESFNIPKLGEGEKIHVNLGGGKSPAKRKSKSSGGGGGGVPMLLKKPPPPAEKDEAAVERMNISMSQVHLDAPAKTQQDESESSGDAVYTGDDDDWDTEFVSANQ